MGIYREWAERYLEFGIHTIPVGNGRDKKAPFIEDWSRWCGETPLPEQIEKWVTIYGHADKLGLPCGPANGIVAFDFDYGYDSQRSQLTEKDFDKDHKIIERLILSALPPTPVKKIGLKGYTAFYKWGPRNQNRSCDRNGVRLFDFLADGRQTIIPPSIHSIKEDKSALYYRWMNQSLEDCLDDLPEIPQELIEELCFLYGSGAGKTLGGRHGELFKFAMSMIRVEKDRSKIVDMMVKKDVAMHSKDPKGPYLSDKGHHKSGDAQANASHWLDRIQKFSSKQGQKLTETKIEDEGWSYFFEKSFYDLRKDILSKKIYVKRDAESEWVAFDGLDGVLRAYASDAQMPKSFVKDEMARFQYRRDKLEFLCDLPEWDGRDYVLAMAQSIKSEYFSGEEISDIFKAWGAKMFSRIEDSKNQNECIILKGPQEIGKDTFVRNMLQGFSPYYQVVSPPSQNKDWLEIVSRLFVCHIEEFDQTGKTDVAFLKSLITQESAFFRESYGRDANKKTTATSYISTVNPEDFFRDTTGNRRFIVIPITKIDFNYPKGVSGQVLAQFKALSVEGFRVSATLRAKYKGLVDQMTPENNEDFIEDIWKEKTAPGKPIGSLGSVQDESRKIKQEDASNLFKEIAHNLGVHPKTVRSLLIRKGYQTRRNNERYWTHRPNK